MNKKRRVLGWMHCRESEDPKVVYAEKFQGALLSTKGQAITAVRNARVAGEYGKNSSVKVVAVEFVTVPVSQEILKKET